MDQIRFEKSFLEYMRSDESAYDLVKANKTFMREIAERFYRLGYLHATSEALTRRSPELEPEPPPRAA